MIYVLHHKIPYYIGTSFEIRSTYITYIFMDCLFWAYHISLCNLDLCLIYELYS